jgi:hypothetical protein
MSCVADSPVANDIARPVSPAPPPHRPAGGPIVLQLRSWTGTSQSDSSQFASQKRKIAVVRLGADPQQQCGGAPMLPTGLHNRGLIQ